MVKKRTIKKTKAKKQSNKKKRPSVRNPRRKTVKTTKFKGTKKRSKPIKKATTIRKKPKQKKAIKKTIKKVKKKKILRKKPKVKKHQAKRKKILRKKPKVKKTIKKAKKKSKFSLFSSKSKKKKPKVKKEKKKSSFSLFSSKLKKKKSKKKSKFSLFHSKKSRKKKSKKIERDNRTGKFMQRDQIQENQEKKEVPKKEQKPHKRIFKTLSLIVFTAILFSIPFIFRNKVAFISVGIALILLLFFSAHKLKKPKIEEKEEKKSPILNQQIKVKPTYKTDFDDFYQHILDRKKVPMGRMSKRFKISRKQTEEWANILESRGLIKINYPMFGEPELRCLE